MSELTIAQVAKILNRSTKSIRNYIKSGTLKARKINSKKGLQYFFQPEDVEDFAKKQLGISLAIEGNETTPQQPSEKKPEKSLALKKFDMEKMDFGKFVDVLVEIENEKMKIIQEFAEYKAQLAYKVGQLESDIKTLETIRKEKDQIEKKLSSSQKELKELEEEYEIRNTDAMRLLKMKEYYDNKRWWEFWKGTYNFYEEKKATK
jgi:DNA-binding transcriptional MerR regulator